MHTQEHSNDRGVWGEKQTHLTFLLNTLSEDRNNQGVIMLNCWENN